MCIGKVASMINIDFLGNDWLDIKCYKFLEVKPDDDRPFNCSKSHGG